MSGNVAGPQELVLDASVLTAWILQQANRWQRVDRLFQQPPTGLVAPVSAVTETFYIARRRGNKSSFQQLLAAFGSFGIRIEPNVEQDAIWAAERIAESESHPAIWATVRGEQRGRCTLSLGDGLILAVAQRLQTVALTFDEAWSRFPTMKLPAASAWKLPL